MTQTTLRMKIKASTVALTLALVALPHAVHAAGLGKITVISVLGQPLRAEVDISASREEIPSLSARIAPNESFRQAGIEYISALSDVRVSVAKRADGRPYLLLKSSRAINEAFIDLLLEMNWDGGHLQREYTFLLDPPDLLQKPAAASTPATSTTPVEKPSTPVATSHIDAPPTHDMKVVRDANGAQRIIKAETPAEPTQKPLESVQKTHQVKQGDTLNKIARNNLPEGVSLDQMLVALFRSNKDAFEGGNINRLKTGRILALPDQSTVESIDAKEARRIIVAQSADFNAYRKKLSAAIEATTPPAQEETPRQTAQGKIEPRLEEPTPPTPGKDKLEISKSAAPKGDHDKDLAARAAAIEENIIAREKSLKEANSRIAELDKSLADMKKLLELKNKSMADAQNQTPPVAAPSPETKPAEKQPASETPVEKPAEKPAEALPSQEQAPATTKPEPAHKAAAPAQTPPPRATPTPSGTESGFIDSNPEVVYGSGGILALLLGYLGLSAWRKRKEAQESVAFQNDDLSVSAPSSSSPTNPSVNSVFGHTGGQVVDTMGAAATTSATSVDTDFSVASAGGTDTSEGVDPIAEADVYMAYGRHEQAEEILLDALKSDPTRHTLHLKLLDIYAARKSLKQFENVARELHTQTSGTGNEWEQAAQLGRSIDPNNTLYGGPSSEAATPRELQPYDPAATMVMTPRDFDKVAAANAPADAFTEDHPESLDFELDLGGDSIQAAAPDSETSGIDLNLDSPAAPPESTALPEPTQISPDVSDDIIDFEIDFPAQPQHIQETDRPETQPITRTAPDEVADLTFDLSDTHEAETNHDATETEPGIATDAIPLTAPRIDLSSISLDLDDTAILPTPTGPVSAIEEDIYAEPTLKFDTSPLPVPDLTETGEMTAATATATSAKSPEVPAAAETALEDDAPGSPEVDTKLELASAYEEMGDHEGARELLQEVLNEGNARQEAMARSKLDQLG